MTNALNIQARLTVMYDSPLIYRAVRWIIALIFIYAGGIKLMDTEAFAVIVGDYGLIPEGLSLPMAIGLPILEIAAGLGLLLDVRGSLAVITGLIFLFMAVLGYGLWLGLDIDCGCFAPGDPEAEFYGGLTQAITGTYSSFWGLFIFTGGAFAMNQPQTALIGF
ncbi:MAG: DoxX family protein [Deltaproteobacteria bacterium]|nr:DoxX family protein [Deltaproteobacteria bacterium]